MQGAECAGVANGNGLPHFPMPDASVLTELADSIAAANQIAVLTGAGLSTESGVPDFRSPGSPWLRHQPLPFSEFLVSEETRLEAWRRKFAMDDLYKHARPSRGHYALARLFASGRIAHLITQNIDDLQARAGVPRDRIIELHGNGGYAACLTCETRHELSDIRASIAASGRSPRCRSCGGLVKSATVAFGQALPQSVLQRAHDAARASDLFIVIGSSLSVRPAAMLPMIAVRHGAKLVIVNGERIPQDDIPHLSVRGDIGGTLHWVIESSRVAQDTKADTY
jgi:NAD-dependent deacetylase